MATLKITDTQLNDIAKYLVVAENKAGKDQTSASLYITELPNVDSAPIIPPDAFKSLDNKPDVKELVVPPTKAKTIKPPKFIIPLSELKVKERNPIKLICKVEGYPYPKV